MFLKIIACEIAYREICYAAARSPNLTDLEFLTPTSLRQDSLVMDQTTDHLFLLQNLYAATSGLPRAPARSPSPPWPDTAPTPDCPEVPITPRHPPASPATP